MTCIRLSLLVLAFTSLFGLRGLSSQADAACPNEALRSGPSAQLPDCRAYELVTPPDSNGRLFSDLSSGGYDQFPNEPSNPFEESLLFATVGSALREPPGGNGLLTDDVYEALRTPSGWQTVRHVTPTGVEAWWPFFGAPSPDHEYNFVLVPHFGSQGLPNGSLEEGGEADYLGDPNGHYELTGVGSLGVERIVQGRYISPGGEHVIFSTGRFLVSELGNT